MEYNLLGIYTSPVGDVSYVFHRVCGIQIKQPNLGGFLLHSKITMAGDVVTYYTVTALVHTLKQHCCFFEVAPMLPWSTHGGTPTE